MNIRNFKQDLIFVLESVSIVESFVFAMLAVTYYFL